MFLVCLAALLHFEVMSGHVIPPAKEQGRPPHVLKLLLPMRQRGINHFSFNVNVRTPSRLIHHPKKIRVVKSWLGFTCASTPTGASPSTEST